MGSPLAVLIVDDSEITRFVVARCLRESDARVFEAADGRSALELLSTTPFPLVISDMQMEGMDGPEFFREACRRGHFGPEDAPVKMFVFATSTLLIDRDEIRRELAPHGHRLEFLPKPFDREQLREVLKQAVSR